MYVNRTLKDQIIKSLQPNKVVILLGARRTGKTEFIKNLVSEVTTEKYLLLNGDDLNTSDLLKERTIENYSQLLAGYDLLIIDEAQEIDEIGKKLKLIVDHVDGIKVLVTGSSAFDISNKLGEPLTGRSVIYNLFPFAISEYARLEDKIDSLRKLNNRLIYGCYPELIHIQSNEEKNLYLSNLVSTYLLKDILNLEGVRNSSKIIDLLRLIAFQIGKEVSLNELSRSLGLHVTTVSKYLDLLSKVFILFRVGAFSRNLRKEVYKSQRWYFYDNGIRNTLINNLNDINLRNDVGELWENYVISERVKYQHYNQVNASNYFWRTYDLQEIDWIEEREGKLFAYEMKWNEKNVPKVPTAWKETYPDSEFTVINKSNYYNWLSDR